MRYAERTRSATREYEFTLRFDTTRVHVDPAQLPDVLAEAGCDDATLGVGIAGRIALMFTREAVSAEDAVLTALRAVTVALPGARLIEAAPDLVGITEIAEIFGRSRQNLRKLLLSCASDAPLPVHEGSSAVWHLARVLEWLRAEKQYPVADELLEVASVNMQLNAASSRVAVDARIRNEIERYRAKA